MNVLFGPLWVTLRINGSVRDISLCDKQQPCDGPHNSFHNSIIILYLGSSQVSWYWYFFRHINVLSGSLIK